MIPILGGASINLKGWDSSQLDPASAPKKEITFFDLGQKGGASKHLLNSIWPMAGRKRVPPVKKFKLPSKHFDLNLKAIRRAPTPQKPSAHVPVLRRTNSRLFPST
jgi:hypothetical protein